MLQQEDCSSDVLFYFCDKLRLLGIGPPWSPKSSELLTRNGPLREELQAFAPHARKDATRAALEGADFCMAITLPVCLCLCNNRPKKKKMEKEKKNGGKASPSFFFFFFFFFSLHPLPDEQASRLLLRLGCNLS